MEPGRGEGRRLVGNLADEKSGPGQEKETRPERSVFWRKNLRIGWWVRGSGKGPWSQGPPSGLLPSAPVSWLERGVEGGDVSRSHGLTFLCSPSPARVQTVLPPPDTAMQL